MQNAFNKTRGILGHAYNHTQGFSYTVDHGFRAATQIYQAVAPLLVNTLISILIKFITMQINL